MPHPGHSTYLIEKTENLYIPLHTNWYFSCQEPEEDKHKIISYNATFFFSQPGRKKQTTMRKKCGNLPCPHRNEISRPYPGTEC